MPVCIVLEMDDDGISPRFDHSALITIYTQIDTLDGQPLEIPGTTAALPQSPPSRGHFESRVARSSTSFGSTWPMEATPNHLDRVG
jgi:hypothetical protein